jgi:hypothetical protein
VAAAVAVKDGVPTSQVKVERVQAVLKAQGVRLY